MKKKKEHKNKQNGKMAKREDKMNTGSIVKLFKRRD